MPKRFSRYQFALKANNGKAEAGAPLDDYRKYKTGEKKVSYTRTTAMLPGEFITIYLIPFGESTDIFYQTQLSKRAQLQESLAGGAAELKYLVLSTLPENAKTSESNKYTPAAVTCFNPAGGSAPEPSKITGVSYKKRGGQSYTLPFGKAASATGTQATFKGRAIEIKEKATTGDNAGNKVSFRPEVLRSF